MYIFEFSSRLIICYSPAIMPADSRRHLHQIVPPTVQPTVIPVKELPQAYPQSISSLHFQAQDFSQPQVSGTAKTQPDFGFKTSQKKIHGVEDYTHWTLSTTSKQIDSPPSSLRPNDLKVPHVYSHLINLLKVQITRSGYSRTMTMMRPGSTLQRTTNRKKGFLIQ